MEQALTHGVEQAFPGSHLRAGVARDGVDVCLRST